MLLKKTQRCYVILQICYIFILKSCLTLSHMDNPEIAFFASCQTHAFILQKAAGGLLLVLSSAHKYKIELYTGVSERRMNVNRSHTNWSLEAAESMELAGGLPNGRQKALPWCKACFGNVDVSCKCSTKKKFPKCLMTNWWVGSSTEWRDYLEI